MYLLVNEGDELIERRVSLAAAGGLELWDPLDGSARAWPGRLSAGRVETLVRLERRQGLVLAVNPQGQLDPSAAYPLVPGEVALTIAGPWSATDTGGQPVTASGPGDWARQPGWETFSGTLCFRKEFELPADLAAKALFLDLGAVADIADVRLNGTALGVRAWAPYVLPLERRCRPGMNTLEVRITNSMANTIQGLQLPSGLLGPVCLRHAQVWRCAPSPQSSPLGGEG